MLSIKKIAFTLALVVISLAGVTTIAKAEMTATELARDSRQALDGLYESNVSAKALSKDAKAILVFPNIVKAGLVFGGSYGEGTLFKGDEVDGYYNSVSGSWGWQIGGQTFGYAVFLMTDNAVEYLQDSKGWEVGAGPTIVVADKGVAENISTSTVQKDAYAFIFDQKGLMAGVSLEGTKISRIKP